MIKIVLNEQKILLNEITVKEVISTVGSKATRKAVYQMLLKIIGEENNFTPEAIEQYITVNINNLMNAIVNTIPSDLEEKQKGISAAWLKKLFLTQEESFAQYVLDYTGAQSSNRRRYLTNDIERYFKYHQFIPTEYRDLMNIPDNNILDDLVQPDSDAARKYKAFMDKKQYGDAKAGTEVIYEDDNWKIFIPNNRGAACELGKGTSWCTAAPGTDTDYYKHYHKPEDPLFIIYDKHTTDEKGQVKYQFHYGSGQFRDAADEQIWYTNDNWKETFSSIHNILLKTVGDKYPIIKTIVQTLNGFSQRREELDDEGFTSLIVNKDLITGERAGGPYPDVSISIYGKDTYDASDTDLFDYQLHWNEIGETNNKWGEKEIGSVGYNPYGPYYIKIHDLVDLKTRTYFKTKLHSCSWGSDFSDKHTARMQFIGNNEYELKIFDQEAWDKNFKQQYENQIRGRESEFAKEILEAFVPNREVKTYKQSQQ